MFFSACIKVITKYRYLFFFLNCKHFSAVCGFYYSSLLASFYDKNDLDDKKRDLLQRYLGGLSFCYISNRVFRIKKIRLISWRAEGCLCGIIRDENIQRF